MPTYEYRCTACAHEFEKFQSMKDKPVRTCPECKRKTVERLIGTGAGIIFKGSGFYETDYRSDAYKKAAAADKKSESGGGSSTTGADAGGKGGGSSGGVSGGSGGACGCGKKSVADCAGSKPAKPAATKD
ncbi:MAG: zinc ribbon domain-containing protein [Phycisphaerales bacterium]|nr:MAG: zinc ribbon domain-containing protein [Phycisphaerales bacterium]